MTDCLTMSVDEAARMLGLGRATVYKAIRNNEIPAVQIGNRKLIPKDAIAEMLRGAKQAA